MKKQLNMRQFLIENAQCQTTEWSEETFERVEIPELVATLPLKEVFDADVFYTSLKRLVSTFNQEASLSGQAHADFDDLHTKYSEYVEAMRLYQSCQVRAETSIK